MRQRRSVDRGHAGSSGVHGGSVEDALEPFRPNNRGYRIYLESLFDELSTEIRRLVPPTPRPGPLSPKIVPRGSAGISDDSVFELAGSVRGQSRDRAPPSSIKPRRAVSVTSYHCAHVQRAYTGGRW